MKKGTFWFPFSFPKISLYFSMIMSIIPSIVIIKEVFMKIVSLASHAFSSHPETRHIQSTYGQMCPVEKAFVGYGWDFDKQRIISFKRDPSGALLLRANSYVLNNTRQDHVRIAALANRIKEMFPHHVVGLREEREIPKVVVSSDDIIRKITDVSLPFQFILYHTRKFKSQCFPKGTTICSALKKLATERSIIFERIEDLKIINVESDKFVNIVLPEQKYKLEM